MNVFIIFISCLVYTRALPTVQPGLFVISGVSTCGNGSGYCVFGANCTVNEDFMADDSGHCRGLRTAFTPETFFSCCRYKIKKSTFDIEDSTLSITSTAASFQTESMIGVIDDIVNRGTDQDNRHIVMDNDIDEGNEDRSARLNDVGSLIPTTEMLLDINHLGCQESIEQLETSIPPLHLPNTIKFDTESAEEEINGMNPRQLGLGIFEDINNSIISATDQFVSDRDCTRHAFTEMLPIPSGAEALGSNIMKERLSQMNRPTCLNLTEYTENVKRCVGIWKFISNDQTLCFGYLIESTWLLTSAACITKIYEARMDSVIVTDMKETLGLYGISNMIVHENYKIEQMEHMNDIGLISLNRHVNDTCYDCLPREDRKFAEKSCITYTSTEDKKDALTKCQDRLKILNMHSKNYLSLQCASDELRNSKMENSSAHALWCENTLVGVQTSYGSEGVFVFTPIGEYTSWIQRNIQMYYYGVSERIDDLEN